MNFFTYIGFAVCLAPVLMVSYVVLNVTLAAIGYFILIVKAGNWRPFRWRWLWSVPVGCLKEGYVVTFERGDVTVTVNDEWSWKPWFKYSKVKPVEWDEAEAMRKFDEDE